MVWIAVRLLYFFCCCITASLHHQSVWMCTFQYYSTAASLLSVCLCISMPACDCFCLISATCHYTYLITNLSLYYIHACLCIWLLTATAYCVCMVYLSLNRSLYQLCVCLALTMCNLSACLLYLHARLTFPVLICMIACLLIFWCLFAGLFVLLA